MSHTKGLLKINAHNKSSQWYGDLEIELGNQHIRTIGLVLKNGTEKEAKANAERLVLCWNSHDELVEALTWAKQIGKNGETHDKMAFEKIETALKNAKQ